jgi:hypothetical protein
MAVLASLRGINYASIGGFLRISKLAARRYCSLYREGGTTTLFARKPRASKKSDNESIKLALFALLHSPPSEHGINRTSWKAADLARVMREQGQPICVDVIRKIIEEAGYKWRRARVVLTSADPEYRIKVNGIKKILFELGQDEAFFSIDEYGPFAVKKRGGVKRVAPGQEYVVPQFQKSSLAGRTRRDREVPRAPRRCRATSRLSPLRRRVTQVPAPDSRDCRDPEMGAQELCPRQ